MHGTSTLDFICIVNYFVHQIIGNGQTQTRLSFSASPAVSGISPPTNLAVTNGRNNIVLVTWDQSSSRCVSKYSLNFTASASSRAISTYTDLVSVSETSLEIPKEKFPDHDVYCVSVATVDTENTIGEYGDQVCLGK